MTADNQVTLEPVAGSFMNYCDAGAGIDLRQGDCLELMRDLPDNSVDLVLCDLPYGTTACAWDGVIPFEPLWSEYRRIAKPGAAIVLTASQPFTTALIASNMRDFRYCWVWEKDAGSNFATVKYQPMKEHEDVCVFYRKRPTYNPQMQERVGRRKGKATTTVDSGRKNSVYGTQEGGAVLQVPALRYPRSIQRFQRERGLHPTQKPVGLMEYLVRTYTNPGDVVLDNCMGSGTTGVACMNTGRRFIGMEMDAGYFEIAKGRIAAVANAPAMDRAPGVEICGWCRKPVTECAGYGRHDNVYGEQCAQPEPRPLEAGEVTQADREAYAAEVERLGDADYAERIRRGKRDTLSLISAFARHAQQARAQALEDAAKVADRHEGKPCGHAEGWTEEQRQFYDAGQLDASTSIAAAIRALQPHGQGGVREGNL